VVDDADIHCADPVEPIGRRGRPNRMFADTEAIRAFGAANSAQAADLAAVAATLASMPGPAAAALGPVGARFLAALAEATTEASRAVSALADRLATGFVTAHASAAAYENADDHTGALVSRVY
jgi:hypothetical protein